MKSLFVAVTCGGMLLGIFGKWQLQHQAERQAAREVHRFGGMVYYRSRFDHQLQGLYAADNSDLHRAFPGDCTIDAVNQSGCSCTDRVLRHLEALTKLERLHLESSELRGLTNLALLNVCDTHVSDTGVLQLIKGLPDLNQIFVDGTKVTRAGVSERRGVLPQLEVIAGEVPRIADISTISSAESVEPNLGLCAPYRCVKVMRAR